MKLLRFKDLKARGIVNNHPQLRRMIDNYGFPPGIKLGENSTAWKDTLVDNWVETRPVALPPRIKTSVEAASEAA